MTTEKTGRWKAVFRFAWGLFKKKALWITLLIAGAVGGGGFYTHRFYKKRQLERVQLDMSTLTKVTKGALENKFEEMGEIAPKKCVNVASTVSGRVVELFVHEGQVVKAGQPLAVVQPGSRGEKFLPSTVVAPVGGFLIRPVEEQQYGSNVKKFVVLDDYVTGRQDNAQSPTFLMSIADMNALVVKLMINEVDVLKFKVGMPVSVKVDSLPDQKFEGTVTMISSQAEEASRGWGGGGKSFRTEVTLKKKDERLRLGVTARVSTIIEKKENVLKMSLSGLFEEEGKTFAYLLVPNDKPREVKVKPGLRTPLDVEVMEGLKEGDQVFTERPVEFTPLVEEKKEAAPAKKV
ncbi:MAG: HlyD family efflux transporter periplasmic adaptor subunit [Elusimicrobiota bacterium]